MSATGHAPETISHEKSVSKKLTKPDLCKLDFSKLLLRYIGTLVYNKNSIL